MPYETAKEIELAIVKRFGIRKYLIVPNVSWGFIAYEADLLILSASGYVWEVEIKVSRGDLLRDRKKSHEHNSERVRQMWFAIPERLENCVGHIPERAGIFVVTKSGRVIERRLPKVNPLARKLSEKERFQLARLGALRIWSLKEKIARMVA